MSRTVEEKAERLDVAQLLPDVSVAGDQAVEDRLKVRLVQVWEELRTMLGDVPRHSRQRFETVFQEEMEAVRAVRNSVAHAVPVPASELQAAVDLAEKLRLILISA